MNGKIVTRLKEFYLLEKFQVAYYQSQLSSTENEYYVKAFEKMVQIEGGHADFFAQQLIAYTGEVPRLAGSLFDQAGTILGESVELTGPFYTTKLGVALESKAMEAYRHFITESARENLSLRNKLMEYLLDEEFHALWLRNYANFLEQKKPKGPPEQRQVTEPPANRTR